MTAMFLGIGIFCLMAPPSTPLIDWNKPADALITQRCEKAVGWLRRHRREVTLTDDQKISVIAWKDPTLNADKPDQLAGYLITDSLWAAHSAKPFDPELSTQLMNGLSRLGWKKNHLHEVLFEKVDDLWHCPADDDFVHGHSLGIFPTSNSQSIDLRVFHHRFDPAFDVGHPNLFAEHAVYRALQEFWTGQPEQARSRIRAILVPTETAIILWDNKHQLIIDQVHRAEWSAWKRNPAGPFRHYSFKGALLLYAMRVLQMEDEYADVAKGISERLWSAQNPDGGIAHYVDVYPDGRSTPARDATGEACGIAILAETVTVKASR